jgi:hypothetical protein
MAPADESSSSSSEKVKHEPVNAAGGWRPVTDEDGAVKDESGTHYCPGCGLRYADAGTCIGTAEAPHAEIATAPVSELKGDEKKHTAAPDTTE